MTHNCCWSADETDFVHIDKFIDHVGIHVPEAPAEVVSFALMTSAIDFADRTRILKVRFSADAQANVPDYALDLGRDWVFKQADNVMLNGQVLKQVPFYPDGTLRGYQEHRGYAVVDGIGLYLQPTPSEDKHGAIKATFTCLPSRDSCLLPRVVYDVHALALAHGALRLLLLDRLAPWFNNAGARDHTREYERCVSRATLNSFTSAYGSVIPLRPQRKLLW